MQVTDYKSRIKFSLSKSTLCYLLDPKRQKILLGLKKTGFGKGKYLGIGGKLENKEVLRKATVRETVEEIKVQALILDKVAVLNFYFPYADEPKLWSQQVHIFTCKSWKGDPQKSAEINPVWFDWDNLPFEQMWDDSSFWLPRVLAGWKIKADFLFNEKLFVEDYIISSLDSNGHL